jgi:hypothetical protein
MFTSIQVKPSLPFSLPLSLPRLRLPSLSHNRQGREEGREGG